MRVSARMGMLSLAFAIAPSLFAQNEEQRLTMGVGALNPVAGVQAETFKTAPLLGFDYGLRFFRYGIADVGVDLAFASEKANDRSHTIYIPRFGYSALIPLPVLNERLETSIGAGAGYSFFKSPLPGGYDTWLVYLQGKVSYAIGVDRKYRAGFFLRWYRDPIGHPVQQFIAVGGDFTFAFGRR